MNEIETRIAEHDGAPARPLDLEPLSFATLARDLKTVWTAPETDARLKKRIVRTVIHEAVADLDDETAEIVLTIHWMGGAHYRTAAPAPPARASATLGRTSGLPSSTRGRSRMVQRPCPDLRGVRSNAHSYRN